MLFDNNGMIDYSFMSNNLSNNALSPKEGLLRGNLFKDEYKPYKNLTFLDINPKNEKEALLFNIMAYSFAINDLNLYLDLHPDDKYLVSLLEEYSLKERNLKNEYNSKYGPLEASENSESSFKWIDSPWPWDNTRGVKYV